MPEGRQWVLRLLMAILAAIRVSSQSVGDYVCESHYCNNAGTCWATYGVNGYRCVCNHGYTGPSCMCASHLCGNGWCQQTSPTTYSCVCHTGWEGGSCNINTNDCFAGACLNGGRCLDGIASYSCDCSGTGFNGTRCEVNIDDCLPSPCRNGATCQDLVKDYHCHCYDGYYGKNCSSDIPDCTPHKCQHNGTCLERSNRGNYGKPSLPPPFNGSFSYSLAAGFVCLCPRGTHTDTCEVKPNDCLVPGTNRSVCAHASACTDGLASFTCHCLPGYEGPTCSVDINECELFGQPCQNGAKCEDLVADYACSGCPAAFGGKNCSVRLTGCDSSPCQNNATCRPTLEQELPTQIHSYRCTCRPGWWGPQCNLTTLASLSGASSFSASSGSDSAGSSGDWIFELSFRTSLAQFDLLRLSSRWGLVRVGAHNSSLVLLFFNASSSVIGRVAWPISDSLVSTDWLTLSVSLTNGSATLTRSESGGSLSRAQTIECLSDSFRPGRVSVDVGGDRGSAIDGRGGFRGCVRDLRLVTNSSTFVATETSVESGNATWGVCSRSEQCASPSPCEAKTSSVCVDVWNDFVCECLAGFGGRSCSVELPSFSLGVGGNASSASFASVPGVSSVYGGDSWTIELRLVTLSRGAFLLLLGDPSDSATTSRLLVTINTIGHLVAQLLYSNGSQIAAMTSPDSVATGSFVFVRISVSISGRQMSLTVASAVRSTSLSSASPLSPLTGRLIIGGFNGAPGAPVPQPVATVGFSRSKRSVPSPDFASLLATGTTAFRGVISAVRVNRFMPLLLGSEVLDYTASLPRSLAATESSFVVLGVVNEDACGIWRPCLHGAACSNIFYNSFVCSCPVGWRGGTCSITDRCIPGSEDCPSGTQCINLEPSGYECRAAATFHSSTSSKLSLSSFGLNESLTTVTGWVRTRELNFVLLSVSSRDGRQLSVTCYAGRLQLSLDNQTASLNVSIATGNPFTFSISCSKGSPLALSVSSDTDGIAAARSKALIEASLMLDSDATVTLGGSGFKGCLNEIRLNGYLAPLSNRSLPEGTPGFAWSNALTHKDSFLPPSIGCQGDKVCQSVASDGTLTSVCQNSGRCIDLWNKFECKCPAGYSGNTCSDEEGSIHIHIAVIIALGSFTVGVVLTVLSYLLLYRRLRKGPESSPAPGLANNTRNQLEDHAYLTADRLPTSSAAHPYEIMAGYDAANDEEPTLAYETVNEQHASAAGVSGDTPAAVEESAYAEIPDLTPSQRTQQAQTLSNGGR